MTHRENAERYVAAAGEVAGNLLTAGEVIALAQVHATLALVEAVERVAGEVRR